MIRLVLFVLLFLWAIRAPYEYRDSIRAGVLKNSPEFYVPTQEREKSQEFIFASQNYKAGDPRRTKSTSELALIRWQQLLIDDAERLYRVALSENKAKSSFDDNLEKTMLHYAEVLDVQEKFDQAIAYYFKVLDYDKKYFSDKDRHIARDYNNLGLSTYLKASSKDRGKERTELLKQATGFYNKAVQIYRTQAKADRAIAVVLYNEHLALRDLNDWDGAQLAKAQAATLDAQFARENKTL